MPITPTTLLRHIKAHLGSNNRPLPITDDEILEVVVEETLPTFSKYYPYMYPLYVNPEEDCIKSDEYKSVYVMNTQGMEVMGVANVYRTDGATADNRYPYYNTNNIFDIAIANNYLSATAVPETFAFYPPSIIELYPKNFSQNKFLVISKCIHLPSFQSIPMKLKDEFFELALTDVKINVYHLLRYYDQLNTPYGNVDLKINDLEEAEGKRNEIIEKFQSKFLKEPERRKIWIK
jgi:hypothetical protein